jgi:superkiller protein 3
VTASLQDLRATQTISDREQGKVGEVLLAIAALSEGDNEKEVLTEIQAGVFLHPNLPHSWGCLAEIEGDEYAADMALKTALKAVPPRGELEADELSKAFGCTGNVGDAQRAIMIAPWGNKGWASLNGALPGRD